jgi:hypothetical protein
MADVYACYYITPTRAIEGFRQQHVGLEFVIRTKLSVYGRGSISRLIIILGHAHCTLVLLLHDYYYYCYDPALLKDQASSTSLRRITRHFRRESTRSAAVLRRIAQRARSRSPVVVVSLLNKYALRSLSIIQRYCNDALTPSRVAYYYYYYY